MMVVEQEAPIPCREGKIETDRHTEREITCLMEKKKKKMHLREPMMIMVMVMMMMMIVLCNSV